METKEAIERIAKLKESDIGPTEENVKQKFIVPLLELLGHRREDLEFEYRTRRGGKIDIFIKTAVPQDSKVIIDTKNYNEILNDYVEQIKEYTFDEGALLAIIANGVDIRIYSPLRGVAFEKSLLFSLKRQNLGKDSVWKVPSDLLHADNLKNRQSFKKIEEREREIKDAMGREETLIKEYDTKIEGIESDIETNEDEIERLKKERDHLTKEIETNVSAIWSSLELPPDLFRISTTPSAFRMAYVGSSSEFAKKAGRVAFQELIDAGLIRNGQTVCFYHTRLFDTEQAEIIASANRLKYKTDGKMYSISELAKNLLIKHGFKRDNHMVAGPRYWKTEDGKLLDDLNEKVRAQRKDRE